MRIIINDNDYQFVDYKNAKIPVTIICKNGHKFSQMPNKHLEGHSCPYCANNVSKPEREIVEYLTLNNELVKTNQRQYLSSNKELDIIIPSKNIAIEFDGLYWHNETKVNKNLVVYSQLDQAFTDELLKTYGQSSKNISISAIYELKQGGAAPDIVLANSTVLQNLHLEGKFQGIISSAGDRIPRQFKDIDGHWYGVFYDPAVFLVNHTVNV
mgnify:CR=1 FL=1